MTAPQLSSITQTLLAAKQAKGLSFTDLEAVVGRDEVWIAALFYQQASASVEEAQKLLAALGLDETLVPALTDYPCKGLGPTVPTDPLIYRFYEIMQVYGMPLKAVIHDKFGDGIMSAIDFYCDISTDTGKHGEKRVGGPRSREATRASGWGVGGWGLLMCPGRNLAC